MVYVHAYMICVFSSIFICGTYEQISNFYSSEIRNFSSIKTAWFKWLKTFQHCFGLQRKTLTNDSKFVRNIWTNHWRCLKPKFSCRITTPNLVIILGIILRTINKWLSNKFLPIMGLVDNTNYKFKSKLNSKSTLVSLRNRRAKRINSPAYKIHA